MLKFREKNNAKISLKKECDSFAKKKCEKIKRKFCGKSGNYSKQTHKFCEKYIAS